ncbi:MAG: TerB family tellurite resistance protein [Pseudomonadota bacterium]|nr:TerB family tellurite resistance protein [Pseudomonadota bacterium]
MLATISSFFDSLLKPGKQETLQSSVDRLHLASAALLVEIANADQEMDDREREVLLGILEQKLQLDKATLQNLWELAHAEHKDATSLFQFTTLINGAYGHRDKVQLLQYMWEVAYADGRIDRYEEHLIRRVADLLYLTHGDFIRTKLAARPAE